MFEDDLCLNLYIRREEKLKINELNASALEGKGEKIDGKKKRVKEKAITLPPNYTKENEYFFF